MILITGAEGFIGKNLREEFNTHDISYCWPDIDCMDYSDFHDVIKDVREHSKIDTIIHCASKNGGLKFNIENQSYVFRHNTQMSLNVLEICREFEIPYFISFITSCGYPDTDVQPYREEQYLDDKPHYTIECHGYAKRNLVLGTEYAMSSDFHPILFCPNTCFGPYDRTDHRSKVMMATIKKFIDAKLKNTDVTMMGNGSVYREFTYVKHVVQVVRKYINKINGTYPSRKWHWPYNHPICNIGPSVELTIKKLTTKIAQLTNFKKDILWDSLEQNGAKRKKLSYAKQSYNQLMPYTIYSFDDAIRETIKWYCQSIGENYDKVIQ